MAQPYVGEIRLFAGNFAPNGWMFCEGQQLSISENETLFQLIGTTYGGDGQETFRLPDLRGRVPVHQGNGNVLASTGGVEDVTLTVNQIPRHSHPLMVEGRPGTANGPGDHLLAQPPSTRLFVEDTPTQALAPTTVAPTGGSQPHTNLQPYLCVHYIISLFGIFPSSN
ncbi:phage tail protein [Nocardioides pacificus]